MKVAELTGAALDYWVAKAEGLEPRIIDGTCHVPGWTHPVNERAGNVYEPHDDWALAGPIIERECIQCEPFGDGEWNCAPNPGPVESYALHWQEGPTLLVAAMRARVASKYGEEVPTEGPPETA